MEELLKDLREVCEKHEMEVKCGQSPIEVKRVNYRHRISDDTHDKVYELNRQMCDLGKTMNDAKCMMDDIIRRAEENIRLHNDNNKYARLVRAAYERKYGKPKGKDIMEEKKTIKEWKEAFAELYKAMRKELGAKDLDVHVCQNEVKPIVNFDIKI